MFQTCPAYAFQDDGTVDRRGWRGTWRDLAKFEWLGSERAGGSVSGLKNPDTTHGTAGAVRSTARGGGLGGQCIFIYGIIWQSHGVYG